jgi:hypothetical protein
VELSKHREGSSKSTGHWGCRHAQSIVFFFFFFLLFDFFFFVLVGKVQVNINLGSNIFYFLIWALFIVIGTKKTLKKSKEKPKKAQF